MPAKINKETINNSNSLEVLDQKIKELETSLTSLKEDQEILKSKIKPYKDNSVSCITKDGNRELTGNWDIGNERKILTDEIRARDGEGLKLYDDDENGIFVEDGGYIGLGTINPDSRIHLLGTSSSVLRLVNTNASSFAQNAVQAGTTKLYYYAFGQNYTLSGRFIPSSTLLESTSSGGMSIGASYYLGVIRFFTNGNNERLRISASGKVGIATNNPTTILDINTDTFRLRTSKTPTSAGASGNQGDWCWDANFIYICTATNTWKRVAIATW